MARRLGCFQSEIREARGESSSVIQSWGMGRDFEGSRPRMLPVWPAGREDAHPLGAGQRGDAAWPEA